MNVERIIRIAIQCVISFSAAVCISAAASAILYSWLAWFVGIVLGTAIGCSAAEQVGDVVLDTAARGYNLLRGFVGK